MTKERGIVRVSLKPDADPALVEKLKRWMSSSLPKKSSRATVYRALGAFPRSCSPSNQQPSKRPDSSRTLGRR